MMEALLLVMLVTLALWVRGWRPRLPWRKPPQHVHFWGPWQDCTLVLRVGGEPIETPGQERWCVDPSCNLHDVYRVHL